MSDFPLFVALVLVYYVAACYFLNRGCVETSSLSTPAQAGTSNLAQPKLQVLEPVPAKRKAGRPRKLINHPQASNVT